MIPNDLQKILQYKEQFELSNKYFEIRNLTNVHHYSELQHVTLIIENNIRYFFKIAFNGISIIEIIGDYKYYEWNENIKYSYDEVLVILENMLLDV